MKVYIVMMHVPYDVCEIKGVFFTKAAAVWEKNRLEKTDNYMDWYVEEWEVKELP